MEIKEIIIIVSILLGMLLFILPLSGYVAYKVADFFEKQVDKEKTNEKDKH